MNDICYLCLLGVGVSYDCLCVCVRCTGPGERIARMELAVLLGTILHQFRVESSDTSQPIRPLAKLLLSPDPSMNLSVKFIPR